MIILEGPDRCGKTTVANALLDLLPGWSYKHHTVPPFSPFAYHGQFMSSARGDYIVDRLHWSEYAYGWTYRTGSGYSPNEFRIMDLLCMAQRAIVVTLTDTAEGISSRWGSDEHFDACGIEQLIERFDMLYHGTSDPQSMVERIEPAPLNSYVDERGRPTKDLYVLASMEKNRYGYVPWHTPSVGMGRHRKAGFLVVGEKPFYSRELNMALPFGPSDPLWDCVDRSGVPWEQGYYTTRSAFSEESYKDFVRETRPKFTVLIGKASELQQPDGLPHLSLCAEDYAGITSALALARRML